MSVPRTIEEILTRATRVRSFDVSRITIALYLYTCTPQEIEESFEGPPDSSCIKDPDVAWILVCGPSGQVVSPPWCWEHGYQQYEEKKVRLRFMTWLFE